VPQVETHTSHIHDSIFRWDWRWDFFRWTHYRKAHLALRIGAETPLDEVLSNEVPPAKLAAKLHSIRRRIGFLRLQLVRNPVFRVLIN
jgi:hypothetical protein